MSKVFKLLKYQYMNSLGLSKGRKKGPNHGVMTAILYAFVGFLMIGMLMVMLSSLVTPIKHFGLPMEFIPFIAFMGASSVVIMTDIIKSTGTIYNVKDFQLLAVLPVSSTKIITAKVLDILLTSYVFFIGIMVPSYIIYFRNVGFDINVLLIAIILLIAGPMIPIVIGVGLGYILFKISSKFKFKDMAMTAIYLVGSFAFLIVVYTTDSWMPWFVENMAGFMEILMKVFVITQWFMGALMEASYVKALLFFGVSVLALIVFIAIIRNTFFKLNSAFLVFGKSEDRTLRESKKQSVIFSLMKVEFIRLISKASVVLNVLSAGGIYVIVTILLSLNLMDSMGNVNDMLLSFGMLTFGMAPTTATSISLEGKAFDMKKALPIRTWDIMKSKIYLNILINIPFLVIGIVVAMVMGGVSISTSLITFAILVLVLVFSSVFGLLVNMKYYTFDWTSEAQVVKKSNSVIFTLIPSMIMFIVTFSIGGIVGPVKYLILGGMYLVAMIAVLVTLKIHGVRMYESIGSN